MSSTLSVTLTDRPINVVRIALTYGFVQFGHDGYGCGKGPTHRTVESGLPGTGVPSVSQTRS